MPFFVYVLRNDETGRHYVGQTDDIAARVAQHNDRTRSRRNYTARGRGSWRVVYQEQVPTRQEARQRENWLKTGTGRDWLRRHLDESDRADGC